MTRSNMQAKTNLPDESVCSVHEPTSVEPGQATGGWQRFLPIFFVVLLGTAALIPAFLRGVPYGPDLPAHFRNTLSFNQSIQHGDLYQSWLAESNGGYGDSSMRLYPPAVHYVFAFARWATGDWYSAALLAFALFSVAGSLGVYFWARSFCSPWFAVFASACYAFAPFHVNELYQSALLAQYAGGAALAFAFGFTERVCSRGRARDVAGLAVSFAILIYTHIPLTMMGAIALTLYALFILNRENFVRTMAKLVVAVLLAVMAGALYWTTLVAEHAWVKGELVDPGTRYNYALNFLFKSFSADDPRNWWINIVAVAMLALLWPAFAVWRRGASDGLRRNALVILVVFSFLMATPLSWPIWKITPKLGSIEFPWRWLAITSMAGSVALAAVMPYWLVKAKSKLRPLALIAAGSVLIALVFSVSHPMRGALYLAKPEFEALIESLPGSEGFEDGLPVWSRERPRPMKQVVEAGPRSITINSWQPEHRTFEVAGGATTEVTEARLRTFYHPHWRATAVDGTLLSTRPAEDGALLISLPPNATAVDLKFEEPFYVRLSAAVTTAGFVFIAGLFLFSFPRTRGLFALRKPTARISLPPTSHSETFVEGV